MSNSADTTEAWRIRMADANKAEMVDLEKLISKLMSVNNMLPKDDGAVPPRISPGKPVRDAIDEMKKHRDGTNPLK